MNPVRGSSAGSSVLPLDFRPLPAGTSLKVLFVYPNVVRMRSPQLGIATLSSCLRRIGAETRLFDATSLPRGGESAAFERAVEDYAPDLIAYSVRSNEWRLTRELLAQGAAYGVTQIVGGQHPTHAPQQTVSHVDALVQGEGEGA
ncbi:MAG: cobalamin B12-binding domain-containing protein, partial [bacterium]|nr:cobalamin B12-binding domain-containing protein [bacterium]